MDQLMYGFVSDGELMGNKFAKQVEIENRFPTDYSTY